MIEVKLKNGPAFKADEADWRIVVPGDDRLWSWADIEMLYVVEPAYRIQDGKFGEGMPIRTLVFEDTSDIQIAVPMPLPVSIEVGQKLMSRKLEVATHLPYGARGLPRG